MSDRGDREEEKLRAALRRHDPPAGFAARVAAKALAAKALAAKGVGPLAGPSAHEGPRGWLAGRWQWTAAIAAGLTVVLAGAAAYQYQRHEQAGPQAQLQAGRQARRQAMVALEIASQKLNLARDRALRQDPGYAADSLPAETTIRKEQE